LKKSMLQTEHEYVHRGMCACLTFALEHSELHACQQHWGNRQHGVTDSHDQALSQTCFVHSLHHAWPACLPRHEHGKTGNPPTQRSAAVSNMILIKIPY